MVEHTILLLKECDTGCKMAVGSMEQILGYAEDKNLRAAVGTCLERHKCVEEQVWKTLSGLSETGKEPGMLKRTWARLSTEVKMRTGGDKEAARILTDGCDMGIKTLCSFKNRYPGASAAAMEMADELIFSEESLREKMKTYL